MPISNSAWEMWIQATILILAVLSLALSAWAARSGSPIIAIFGRWARWFFISALAAGITYFFGWTGYGFPTLLVVALLLHFLLETTYNWLAISALSKSDLPLFPKFEENERGNDWPSNPDFIKLKGWLRNTGFLKRQSLVSMAADDVRMWISSFENEDQTNRLHILFLPNSRGNTVFSLSFFSETRSGDCILTDNLFLPFGGFYPEHWDVERRPWTRSAEKLLQRHRARIDAKGQPLIPFVKTPLEKFNEDQRMIERLNRDLGFLTSPPEVMEKGRLTSGGKARLWQEIWSLSYLGKSLKY